jgi:hypothetical protein
LNNLKVVTIESAIDLWHSKKVKEIFNSLIEMKMSGYQEGFKDKYNVLPFDGTDFIGTHHLICSEQKSKLIPLLAYKSCSKKECDKYNIAFTAINSVASAKSEQHLIAIKKLVENSEEKKQSLAYDSSFTINPIVKEDPELGHELFSIFFSLCVNSRQEYQIDQTIMLANQDFKTDVMFKKMGSYPLSWNNEEMPAIVCPYLGFSNMKIFICDQSFSRKALSLAAKYQSMWRNRLLFSRNNEEYSNLKIA